MKNFLLTLLFIFSTTVILSAQEDKNIYDFSAIETLDNANKIIVNLKAKSPENVLVLEKDYIVSSDRVKGINKRFTDQENAEGNIITVTHNGLEDFSEEWIKLIKLLINDPKVIKLREYEEGNFQMLVQEDFDRKNLEKIAAKAKWPISLSE